MTTLQPLSHYGLSAERGFLSSFEIDEIALPADFAAVIGAANALSGLMTSGRIRSVLDDLPQPDMAGFIAIASDAQLAVAMVRYSFLVQAYVWGEAEAPHQLPASLAQPIVALADALHTLLHRNGYTVKGVQKLIAEHGADGLVALANGTEAPPVSINPPPPALAHAPATANLLPELQRLRDRLASALAA